MFSTLKSTHRLATHTPKAEKSSQRVAEVSCKQTSHLQRTASVKASALSHNLFVGKRSGFSTVPVRHAANRTQAIVQAAAVADAEPKVRTVFPFTQMVGQADMKLGLMLNIVEPALGGVLIMGDRGTGKSLAVRALAAIVPDIDVVVGDNYNSSPTNIRLMGPEAEQSFKAGETFDVKQMQIPLVELPLGATEDRVCGTIDIERALTEGVKAYEPGLLAKANQGILYVDEVNLLEDGLVDVVLDSAASGWNTVEREGVSIGHPASFILVGSGTESQGELRPQLLDRFGLSVKANTITDADERVDMVVRRTAYEKDPKCVSNPLLIRVL